MRLIDADALEKDANEDLLSDTDTAEEVYWNDGAKSIIDLIKTAPTIEPKKGKWMHDKDDELYSGYCSCCGWTAVIMETDVADMPFCPNCGARMERCEE